MNRDQSLQALASGETWDLLLVGGGATGLGAAVDAASRGYRVALLEARDFASGTSSRSTKLVHGGVRYLRQGNIALVRDSLRERALLLRNAPHLSRPQAFIVPAFGPSDRLFYGAGLKLYDALAGHRSLGASEILSRDETLRDLPGVRAEGLRGGVRYYDGQFDDARLALALAQQVHDLGGVAVNYLSAADFLKENGQIRGVVARDAETGREFSIRARAVINATGVFTDQLRRLDDSSAKPLLTVSQGAHLVLNQAFFPGSNALMVPKTRDGRVLFAIPWMDRVVLGTTDTPVSAPTIEPRPFASEISFLLEHAALYLSKEPSESDILSAFAGLRPLVKGGAGSTAQLSRDHTIVVSGSGLVSITGGKWTTYRKMGEDVINRAAQIAGLPIKPSRTSELTLPRLDTPEAAAAGEFVQKQMARTVEDILARRTRLLLLDARAAVQAAPAVASALASVLGRDARWIAQQIDSFRELALAHLPPFSTAPSSPHR